MSADLNEQDSNKLFNEISKDIQDNDSVKLSELTEEPALEDKKEEQHPEDLPEKKEEKDSTENMPEDKKEDDDSPPDEADNKADDKKVEEKPDEPDELAKLREQVEKLSKANHDLRSQAGRVPYVQKRIRELDKKLEELTKSQ